MRKLILLAILTVSSSAVAEPTLPLRLSVETDPSSFALGGFSAWAVVKPAHTEHLRVGAGALGLEFPSFAVPYLNRSGEEGWGLEVRAAMGFAAYQFGHRRGLYVGAYSGYLAALHTRTDTMGTARRDFVTVLPTIGYQWFPFTKGALAGAYVEPWGGATVWIPVGGTSTLGAHTFKDPHAIPLAAVNLGYEF